MLNKNLEAKWQQVVGELTNMKDTASLLERNAAAFQRDFNAVMNKLHSLAFEIEYAEKYNAHMYMPEWLLEAIRAHVKEHPTTREEFEDE